LARDLAVIPALAVQVDVTISRQGATAGSGGARSAVRPVPFDVRASAALGDLKAILVGWVRVFAEGGTDWPVDSVGACADWLGRRVADLRVHPAAGEIVTEVGTATAACWWAIDRAPELSFAGACVECAAPLYVAAGAAVVRCPTAGCAASYDLTGRRAFLLDAARDYVLTAAELRRALPAWGAPLNDSTLRSWRARGRLRPAGEVAGRAVYRIGDVLDLLIGAGG
jgi:hypothetical protein